MTEPKTRVPKSQLEPEIAAAVKKNYASSFEQAATRIRNGASLTDNYQFSLTGLTEPFGLRIRIGRKGKRKLVDLYLDSVGLSVLKKYIDTTNPHGSVAGPARVAVVRMSDE